MPAKKKSSSKMAGVVAPRNSFASFLSDPLIATALIVFGLVALMLSIIEFTEALAI